jgi:surfeit locus 1 family protein
MKRRFSWRSAVVLIATVLMVALTARLGLWQQGRAAQKTQLQQALDERGRWPVLQQDALPLSAHEAPAQYHRPVHVQGRWAHEATVYLENRQMKGRPGFFVLTPLLLEPTNGPTRAILVQRGWLPRDNNDRTRLAPLPTTPGPVQVQGLMAPPPARLFEFEATHSGRIRQNLDIAAYALETGLPLLPYMVLQTRSDAPEADGLQRDWPAPAVDVHKHHGYAFQWFVLSALLTVLYLWFQILKPWRVATPNRQPQSPTQPSAHDET